MFIQCSQKVLLRVQLVLYGFNEIDVAPVQAIRNFRGRKLPTCSKVKSFETGFQRENRLGGKRLGFFNCTF